MLLEPVDPNERFRERRRQARYRRAVRRVGLLAAAAITAAALALGMSVLGDGGEREQPGAADAATTDGDATATATAPAPPPAEPDPMPDEMRGVHVTMALASLDGKLGEYYSLAKVGLNTLELDVKDENGEVAFGPPGPELARKVGAAQAYYDPRTVARQAEARGLYLVGRVVVFEDPVLSRARPGLAIRRSDGGVWTNSAGLGWTNPYDERVWRYNVDIAEGAVRSGFDEIMFDYVRFPTDGDISSAVFPKRKKEKKHLTIARFLEYARGRLEPLGARVSAAVFGLSATRDLGIGQRPRVLSRHLDVIYPMVYPSHYGPGEFNLNDPNGSPGPTVARSLRDFRKALRGRDTILVPWLQDFSLGRDYGLPEVRAQIFAARNASAGGYLLWNPSGLYTDGALAGS